MLGFLLLFAIVGAAGAGSGGRASRPPAITIASPGAVMGVRGVVDSPSRRRAASSPGWTCVFEQKGKETTAVHAGAAGWCEADAGRVRYGSGCYGARRAGSGLPELKSGRLGLWRAEPACCSGDAHRRGTRGRDPSWSSSNRRASGSLAPPFHQPRRRGLVVFRGTPADVAAGVKVGDANIRLSGQRGRREDAGHARGILRPGPRPGPGDACQLFATRRAGNEAKAPSTTDISRSRSREAD